jgi:hypothetical protein
MKKGIVMDINDSFLTLLTPEGEFLRARKQDQPYTIGEEIRFFPILNDKTSKSNYTLKNIYKVKTVWALMAALVIMLGSFFPIYQNNQAYAYMSIDVNPSIELGVNKNMQVVELNGFNKQGNTIISQLGVWKKKDVSELTKAILKEMKEAGYLRAKKQVIISTVRTKVPEEKIEKKLQENIEAIKTSVASQQVELTVLTATQKEREKAQKLGISTGKYQENKIKATNNQKDKDKDKDKDKTNEKKQDNAVPQQPTDHVSPGQIKKLIENNKVENKKKNENKRSDELSIPPGQLKKMEEEQVKQNQEQQREQAKQNQEQQREQLKQNQEQQREQAKQNQEQQREQAKQNQEQQREQAKQNQEQQREQAKQNQEQQREQFNKKEKVNENKKSKPKLKSVEKENKSDKNK